jgi:hypothetical protein
LLGCERGGVYKPQISSLNLKKREWGNVDVRFNFVAIFTLQRNDILLLCPTYTTMSWIKN